MLASQTALPTPLSELRALLSGFSTPSQSEGCATGWRRLVSGWPGPRLLVDLVASERGSGAELLGLLMAIEARRRGQLVVVNTTGSFFPPSAAAWGTPSSRLLLVHPNDQRQALASVELCLRSPSVGAVWAQLDRIDGRAFRRLALAAEHGEALGVLVRPAVCEGEPTWADVQLRVEPRPTPPEAGPISRRLRLTQLRNRRGPARGSADVVINGSAARIEDVPPHRFSTQHAREETTRDERLAS